MPDKTKQDKARLALGLLDLTSLSHSDSKESITALCQQAVTPEGSTAAVCVYPSFVPLCRQLLAEQPVKVAAVANFPSGDEGLATAVAQTREIVSLGGNEVDVVIPYRSWLAGDHKSTPELIKACKEACGEGVALKVILESGSFDDQADLRDVSRAAIGAGADFIKTSTGKTEVSATLEAARTMLQAIKDSGRACGFKASGGIRTTDQAIAYLDLAAEIMGPEWISANTFRFGASGLLKDLLATLGHEQAGESSGSGY